MKLLLSLCLLFGFIGIRVQAQEDTSYNEMYTGTHDKLEDDFTFEENLVSFDFRDNENTQDSINLHSSDSTQHNVMQIGAGGVNGSTIYVYPTKNTSVPKLTYISNSATYNADSALLEVDGDWYRIKIAGIDGWINLQDGVLSRNYNDLRSVSHYSVSDNGNIIHFITKNVDDTVYSQINNGPAPSYMKKGVRYFSYDGHYFYTDFSTMIADNKANISRNAVNPNQPYFNYFQFLPMRSESKLSSNQIDDYLTKYRGYTSLIPRKTTVNLQRHESNLFGIGVEAASLGINLGNNHGTTLGIAINESGWGRSSIAATKNNVFGHSAYDSYPGAAGAYNSVGESFHAHNTNYLNAGYLVATDLRYEGGYVGNKSSGINVHYASDSYWGEKAADQYRTLDTYNKSQDYGNYQFAYKNSSNITNVSKTASSRNVIPNMKLKNENQVFLYLGTVDGENIKGSTQWYKIAVDSLLDSNKNIMKKNESIGNIDFEKEHHVGYVHSSEFEVTDKLKNHGDGWTFYPSSQKWAYKDTSGWAYGIKEINGYKYYFDERGYTASGWVKNNGKYLLFDKNASLLTGWYEEKGKKYYLNSETGIMQTQWSKIDGSWYYFNSSGALLSGWQTINGSTYKLDSEGKMITGWHKDNGKWYYLQSSGRMTTGWNQVGLKWYYLQQDGVMATNWLNLEDQSYYLGSSGSRSVGWTKVDGTWYHFDEEGRMNVGWLKLNDDWYYLNSDGSMAVGWKSISGSWYYLQSSGRMATGWNQVESKWYYLQQDGVMETNWLKLGDKSYYLGSSGSRSVGWTKVDGTWYHFDEEGHMNVGWLKLNDHWYYLNIDGSMAVGWEFINGSWYYLQESGRMSTGWIKLSGKWYFLYSNGRMAYNTTIGKYEIGADGVML